MFFAVYRGTGGPIVVTASSSQAKLNDIYMQAGAEMGYEEKDINGEDQIGICLNYQEGSNKLYASRKYNNVEYDAYYYQITCSLYIALYR